MSRLKDRIQSAFAQISADETLTNNTAAYLHRELEKRGRKSKKTVFPKLAGAFAAMAVLVVGFFTYNLYFTASAYISIDVNPSVEFTLNRFDRVIASRAYNGDGERILSEADLRGKTCSEAVGLVLSLMEADGYFKDDALVSATVQAAGSGREQQLCSSLQQFISEKVLSIQARSEVEVFPVSMEVLDHAHECNMSPARYLAMQELMEVDEEATMEAYDNSSIRQIRRRTQECRNAHGSESDGAASDTDSSGEYGYGYGQGQKQEHNQGQEQGQGQGQQHGQGEGQGHGQGTGHGYGGGHS